MKILSLKDVSLAYGHHPLLSEVDFQIEKGERVCLVGRNGTGKSTLFRVISGQAEPDEGEIWHKDTLRISYLEQEVPDDIEQTIYEVVAGGLGELGQILSSYHKVLHEVDGHSDEHLRSMSDLQHRIEILDGWNIEQKIESVLSRLDLDSDKKLQDCSGGVRRRVLLAQALVSGPELLLLDEPTNHMDIAAIYWLEEFLKAYQGALIFITHDRTFLKNLATRIIELDRGVLTSFPGNYDKYLERKEAMYAIESRANARFDKKLSEEEVWIRKGIKARRTRNEGRVRQLEAMREARRQRIDFQGKASLNVDTGETAGKIVTDLQHVSFSFGEHCIIRDLSTRILRGDRVGIVGPNGSGKSTLLKLILGELKPDSGKVILGTKLDTAYFDQNRSQLDPGKSVRDNICEGTDYITIKGRPRHVIGYLKSFLFPPERVDGPARILSGGERNRLLLAKLFTQPANMLVLDEPTNDLDVDTLELLEDLLTEYKGTILLVSHDRTFLDNVVTSTIVFEGDGQVGEYVGGYADWLRQRKQPVQEMQNTHSPVKSVKNENTPKDKPAKPKIKLSYKEQRELEELPGMIETMEAEQLELEQEVSKGEFYQQDKDIISSSLARLDRIRNDLEQAYLRWQELDNF